MDIDEQLAQAIFDSDPEDLQTIRKYIAWVKFRRKMNYTFYPCAHWVAPKQKYHWI